MIDIVMLVQNRPRLVDQAIGSLVRNTATPWRMTIVDDGSGPMTEELLKVWQRSGHPIGVVRREVALGPGRARNLGIERHEENWGRGDWLYLCDSDSYHKPGWDEKLLAAFPIAADFGYQVLAGYVHPYNLTNATLAYTGVVGSTIEIHEKYAVGLLSWLWKWSTWDEHKPFDEAPYANGSEDVAMCHRIRLAGGRVGCVWPWVVVNTGMTGSSGKLSPGSELIFKQPDLPEGIVIE